MERLWPAPCVGVAHKLAVRPRVEGPGLSARPVKKGLPKWPVVVVEADGPFCEALRLLGAVTEHLQVHRAVAYPAEVP